MTDPNQELPVEDEIEATIASPPDETAGSAGNPNSPTLSKAGLINGLTVDVSRLTSDFIELGEASDLDGDDVTVTVEIEPSTALINYDSASGSLDLQVEKLFAQAEKQGGLSF